MRRYPWEQISLNKITTEAWRTRRDIENPCFSMSSAPPWLFLYLPPKTAVYMFQRTASLLLFFIPIISFAQSKLTVEKIMRDPKWMGTSPSGINWSQDGQYLYFNWNPHNTPADSIYYSTLSNHTPVKAAVSQRMASINANSVSWNQARTAYVY